MYSRIVWSTQAVYSSPRCDRWNCGRYKKWNYGLLGNTRTAICALLSTLFDATFPSTKLYPRHLSHESAATLPSTWISNHLSTNFVLVPPSATAHPQHHSSLLLSSKLSQIHIRITVNNSPSTDSKCTSRVCSASIRYSKLHTPFNTPTSFVNFWANWHPL